MPTYQISPSGPYFQFSDLPTLANNDRIEFDCGGIYEPFSISGLSGIVVTSFGTGDKPIISSFVEPTFVSIGGGLWEYENLSLGASLRVLTIDGVLTGKGRFPKGDNFRDIFSNSANDLSLTDSETPPIDFTGAKIVIRKELFITDTFNVTDQTGALIEYDGDSEYFPKQGYGFFFQNHTYCLTEFGEWMYDSVNKKVIMYFGLEDPTDYQIRIPLEDNGITISNLTDCTLSNLDIVGFEKKGVNLTNSTGIVFTNVLVQFVGEDCFYSPDASIEDCQWVDCSAFDAHNRGIYCGYLNHGLVATGCDIQRCSIIMGGSEEAGNGDSEGNGITFQNGTDCIIENCTINDIGFNGASINGNGSIIRNCLITNVLKTKADGGGIYMSVGGTPINYTVQKQVYENRVIGVNAYMFGSPEEDQNVGYGIYMDDNENNTAIYGNLMKDCQGAGMYFHNCYDISFTGNTMFSNNRQFNFGQDSGLTIRDITFSNNILVAVLLDQVFGFLKSSPFEPEEFGVFSNNDYYYSENNLGMFGLFDDGTVPKNFYKSWAAWQTLVGESGSTYTVNQFQEYTEIGAMPSFTGEFGLLDGCTFVGGVLTKTSGGQKISYMPTGTVVNGENYLFECTSTGNLDGLSLQIERSEPNNPNAYQKPFPKKFASPDSAIILNCYENRASGQIMWLTELNFTNATFGTFSLTKINLEPFVPLATIVLNEDSWDLYLDGVIPDITFPDGTFVYDGTEKSIEIEGELPIGASVEYESNTRTNVGTQEATATISESGEDDIILNATLTITPATITGITFPDQSFVYDGTEKSLAIVGSLPSGTSVEYSNNGRIDVGTQVVTATISGANYTTLILTADLTITLEIITGVTFEDGSFIYDGSSKSLAISGTLPDGGSVSYDNNGRTNVGTQVVTATVTAPNYEPLILFANLTITPATITGVTFESQTFVFDGTEKSIEITGDLPDGVDVSYQNNTRTAVGSQEATALLTGANYNDLTLNATITITDPDTSHYEKVRLNTKVTKRINAINRIAKALRMKTKIR